MTEELFESTCVANHNSSNIDPDDFFWITLHLIQLSYLSNVRVYRARSFLTNSDFLYR
jgi:hypothetical protein